MFYIFLLLLNQKKKSQISFRFEITKSYLAFLQVIDFQNHKQGFENQIEVL
jgi:hypothetical protein